MDDEESNKFKLQLELIDNLQARVKELEDENGSLQCRVNDINVSKVIVQYVVNFVFGNYFFNLITEDHLKWKKEEKIEDCFI